MADSAAASLLADSTSLAPSTLERATLTGRSTTHTTRTSVEPQPAKQSEMQPGESGFFWSLVGVLLLLALGNLLLTFFAMGVLRLGYGMESIELIPGTHTTKFYGRADLGNMQKKDGIIHSYADVPFTIQGDNSQVLMSLRTSHSPPVFSVGPQQTEIKNVNSFKVVDPASGNTVFSTHYPNFGLPRGVKNLKVQQSKTARVTSPVLSDLKIRSDSTIRLKGNEGLKLNGEKLTWSADQDIYMKSVNGSIVLETQQGIMVDVNTLPLAEPLEATSTQRGQYKLCMCLPQAQLFRVPIPRNNGSYKKFTCASFQNPCTTM